MMSAGNAQPMINPAGMTWSPEWLGDAAHLYRPDAWRSSRDIPLARFRQIYLWPLTLRLPSLAEQSAGEKSTSRLIEHAIARTNWLIRADRDHWKEVDDLLCHAPPPTATRQDAPPGYEEAVDQAQRYGEFVYFHDFVQSVLYRRCPDAPAARDRLPFRVYRRSDVESRHIQVDIGSRRFTPRVERCNLYIFRTGAAVLAVEIDFGLQPSLSEDGRSRPIKLSDALDFTDKGRRSYSPYYRWDDEKAAICSGDVVDRFHWREPADGQPEARADALSRDLAHIERTGSAPMAEHWREILQPLKIAGYEAEETSDPVWRHVVDDRIPVMSFLSLTGAAASADWRDDLWMVSRGDWIRICEADSQGSEPLPYAPSFMRDFESRACYDRYFPSGANRFFALRYMFAGYHFAAVGSGEYFDHTLVHHFRRHYFQMALLLHMDFASLLAMSSRISDAVRRLHERLSNNSAQSEEAQHEFRQTIAEIERDFLELVHQFHFTGLSNQLQAREMFQKWRKSLGLDELFGDLKDEIESATQFLYSSEQVRQAEAATRLSETANKLAGWAAVAVLFGLVFSLLGMNVLVSDGTMQKVLNLDGKPGWISFLRQLLPFGVALLGVPAGLHLLRRLLPPSREGDRPIVTAAWVWTTFGLSLGAIVLGLIGCCLTS
jgi:hypothetical protein